MKLPTIVETTGGVKLRKLIGFAAIGCYRHPKTGEMVVIDFRDEWKAEA